MIIASNRSYFEHMLQLQANKLPDYKLRPWIINDDLEFEEERQLMRFERTIISTSPLDKEQGQSCLDLQDLLGAESATPRIKMDPYSKTAAVRHQRFLREMAHWQNKLDESEANDIMMRTKMGLPLPTRAEQVSSASASVNPLENVTSESVDNIVAVPSIMTLEQKKLALRYCFAQTSVDISIEQKLLESGLLSDESSSSLVSSLMLALEGIDLATITAEERQQLLNKFLVEVDPAEAAMIVEPIDVPETGSYYRQPDSAGDASGSEVWQAGQVDEKRTARKASSGRYTGKTKRRPGSAVFMPKYSQLPPRPGTSSSTPHLRRTASSQRFRPTSSQGVPRAVSADPLSSRLNLISSAESKPIDKGPTQNLDKIDEPQTISSTVQPEALKREETDIEESSPARPFTPSERKVNVASLTASKSIPSFLATQKPGSARNGVAGVALSPISSHLYPAVLKTGKKWNVKTRPHRSCDASLRRRTGAVPLDPSWKPPLAVDPNQFLLEALKTTAEYKERNSKDSTWRLLQSTMPKSVAANIWKSNTRKE